MDELIEKLNQLQSILVSFDLKGLIQLPEIVVVGDQSSGKSSVLQSIFKKDILPKGSGIVTKCPIRISMHNSPSREFATFPHLGNQEYSLDEVCDILKEKGNEISLSCGGISETEILVNLYGPEMTTMTLIDLPGIVRVADYGQRNDIVTAIKNLIMSRIRDERVLILAVTPGSVDIVTSGALEFSKIVDPDGERTIGVLTKMDEATNNETIIKNLDYKLKLGIVGVKCRSQEDLNNGKNVDSQIREEEFFFKSKPYYMDRKDCFGISNLIKKLKSKFKLHVEKILPDIQMEIKTNLDQIEKNLIELGDPLSESIDYSIWAHSFVDDMFRGMQDMMNGSFLYLDCDELIGGSLFRKEIKDFHNIMGNITCLKKFPKEKIDKIAHNSCGLQGISSISDSIIKRLIKDNLNLIRPEIMKLLRTINLVFDKFLEQIYNRYISQYKKLRLLFIMKFAEAKQGKFKETEEQLNFLVNLEIDYFDPDMICYENKNFLKDHIETITLSLFLEAKNSLNSSVPKYIKHFFILPVIEEAKALIHKHIKNLGDDSKSLFQEPTEKTDMRKLLMSKRNAYLNIQNQIDGIAVDIREN